MDINFFLTDYTNSKQADETNDIGVKVLISAFPAIKGESGNNMNRKNVNIWWGPPQFVVQLRHMDGTQRNIGYPEIGFKLYIVKK